MARLQKVHCRDMFLKGGLASAYPAHVTDLIPVQQSSSTEFTVTSVFDSNAGESVPDTVKFLQQNGAQFSVFSLDFNQRVLGLVRVKDGIDIRKAPFLYQAQREHAEELLLIPFDELEGVVAALTETMSTVKNIFLHSTGRCGSTLMCKAMDVVDGVQSLSEPDVFSIVFERFTTKDVPLSAVEEQELIMLLRCSTVLLNFYLLENDPDRPIICYKHRSAVIFIADLLQRAAPEAKTIFLYRDLPGFYDSNVNVIFSRSYWRYFCVTALRFDVFFALPKIKSISPVFRYIPEHPRVITCPVTQGMPFMCVCLWVLQMQKAFELIQEDSTNFFHVCLTYRQLLEHKEQIVLKALGKLDVNVPLDVDVSKIRKVFGVDSQEGSFLQGGRGQGKKSSSWVGNWEKNLFSTVLEHVNGDVNEPDFIMPYTMVMG